jgi:hypothetical protein
MPKRMKGPREIVDGQIVFPNTWFDNPTALKKRARAAAGLCVNCGVKKPCACAVPKRRFRKWGFSIWGALLPEGIRRFKRRPK